MLLHSASLVFQLLNDILAANTFNTLNHTPSDNRRHPLSIPTALNIEFMGDFICGILLCLMQGFGYPVLQTLVFGVVALGKSIQAFTHSSYAHAIARTRYLFTGLHLIGRWLQFQTKFCKRRVCNIRLRHN